MATIETVDQVVTQTVEAQELQRGDYVLLAEDIDDEQLDLPLLVAADYDQPRLWRFEDQWSTSDGIMMLIFVDEDTYIEVPAEPTARICKVAEGQHHDRWDLPDDEDD
jgi:hypothetical protein